MTHQTLHDNLAEQIKTAAHVPIEVDEDMALSLTALVGTLTDANLELLVTLATTERDYRMMKAMTSDMAQDKFDVDFLR